MRRAGPNAHRAARRKYVNPLRKARWKRFFVRGIRHPSVPDALDADRCFPNGLPCGLLYGFRRKRAAICMKILFSSPVARTRSCTAKKPRPPQNLRRARFFFLKRFFRIFLSEISHAVFLSPSRSEKLSPHEPFHASFFPSDAGMPARKRGFYFSRTALMRRIPAPQDCSLTIRKCPSSPVAAACGPPQISLENVPME